MKRPTAQDRDIADYVRRLPVGRHLVEVTNEGVAKLKVEGGLHIWLADRHINFMPYLGQQK